MDQLIRFCTAPDGTQIAYSVGGGGPPLVKTATFLSHLEADWESPVWRHLLQAFSIHHTLIRYDQRSVGLSDWQVPEFTFDGMVDDLGAVIDAAGLEHFSLLGISQGCSLSIAYAIRNPERVSRLILYGGFAKGSARSGSEMDRQLRKDQSQMIREGWGKDNPAFRQFFTSLFMPVATREQMNWFNELQKVATSPENAARIFEFAGDIDISDLCPRVSVPTLVLHCRDDGMVSFERGRRMAAMIPDARFIALDGKNHIILEDDPAWPRFIEEVSAFLAKGDD